MICVRFSEESFRGEQHTWFGWTQHLSPGEPMDLSSPCGGAFLSKLFTNDNYLHFANVLYFGVRVDEGSTLATTVRVQSR
ncbi:hypothetical protein AHF37_11610 [Paragonimus kellicotti]|nr:hypothetical protein AHF37_11610 [Paragonimus kellicotti]